jgi:hypothetical protein
VSLSELSNCRWREDKPQVDIAADFVAILLVTAAEALVPGNLDIVHVIAECREQASGHDPQVAQFLLPEQDFAAGGSQTTQTTRWRRW